MSSFKNIVISIAVLIIVAAGRALSSIYGIFFSRNRDKVSIDKKRFYKVLVIKLWAIGEVCMITPLVRELKHNFPNMSLSILTGKNSADIFKNNPNVDEIIGVDERSFLNFNLIEIAGLLSRLKSERFDIAITLHHFVLFNIFAWLGGARIRVGFDRNGEGFLNTIKVASDPKKHKILEYLSIVEALGGRVDDRETEIFPTAQTEEYVEDFLGKSGISENDLLIGIMPTGGKNPASKRMAADLERKVWPLNYYTELSRMLTENLSAKVIVMGGRDEVEKASVIKSRKKENVIDATGRMNLRQLKALAQKCDLIVTNDSGPMHIVTTTDTPIISIFGPTDPFLCGPTSKYSYVINKNPGCGPCFRGDVFPNIITKCDKNPTCMEMVKPEEVLELVKEKLHSREGAK